MGPYEKIRGTEFPLVTPYFGQHPAHISWMGGGLLEYGTRHEKPAVEWNSGRTASPAWSPISIKISISSKLCARSKQPNVRFVRRCGWVPARAVIQLVSNCLTTKTTRRRRHCTILAGWVDDDDGGVDGYKRPPVWWRRLVHCKNGIPSHLSGDILWDRGVQILKRIRQYVWWPCRLFCWLETSATDSWPKTIPLALQCLTKPMSYIVYELNFMRHLPDQDTESSQSCTQNRRRLRMSSHL